MLLCVYTYSAACIVFAVCIGTRVRTCIAVCHVFTDTRVKTCIMVLYDVLQPELDAAVVARLTVNGRLSRRYHNRQL